MKKLFLLLSLCCNLNLFAQGRLIPNPIRNIPKWVRTEFSAQHLDQRYAITFKLYPYYLRGDFNGDGRRDIAIQVEEKTSGKSGIAIFHAKQQQKLTTYVAIIGAGKTIGNDGDNLKWVNMWNVHRRGKSIENLAGKSPTLIADAILAEKRDSINGLIFWDGKKYTWFNIKNKK